MSTSQQFLVADSSSLANFKQWAQAISSFFTTASWTQSTDTGQVNWSTIVSVPGSGAYVFEIWQPNDGLTNFYVKIEYGNFSGTNSPNVRITIGSSTNGAGTLTGFVTSVLGCANSAITPPSTTTQYECNFSGAAGRIGVMMWRNAPSANAPQIFFAIERSLNVSGAYTSGYVTAWTCGAGSWPAQQQSLVLGVGAAKLLSNAANASGWCVRYGADRGVSSSFNGSIPFDLCAPVIGYYDFQCTVAGSVMGIDMSEGVTFTASVYGSTRTYMFSKATWFGCCGPFNSLGGGSASGAYGLGMRYD